MIPKFDKADWNKEKKGWDVVWSSAFIFICALHVEELIIHSTRKFDESDAFCAKKKNLKFGDFPPEAIQLMWWACMWRKRGSRLLVNAATPCGLIDPSCNYINHYKFLFFLFHPKWRKNNMGHKRRKCPHPLTISFKCVPIPFILERNGSTSVCPII